MHKINSALVKKQPIKYLQKTYNLIYEDSSIWKFSKFDGVHAVIWNLAKDYLPGNKILDVGCGTGRLSFYLGLSAKKVIGIDFSEKAIEKANFLKSYVKNSNTEFFLDSFESLKKQSFNVIIFADVLEHVADPEQILNKAKKLLLPKGKIIFSCPGFMNLRGLVYKTFLNTLELPMSLADLRQVDNLQVTSWVKRTGFKIIKVVGALYDLGWSEAGIKDLINRVPKALTDKKLPLSLLRFNTWINREKKLYNEFYSLLQNKYLIKPINLPELYLSKPENINLSRWQDVVNYLTLGFKRNPYYCDTYPYNLWGGEEIYVLQKR